MERGERVMGPMTSRWGVAIVERRMKKAYPQITQISQIKSVGAFGSEKPRSENS
jgi:hypothetical protein